MQPYTGVRKRNPAEIIVEVAGAIEIIAEEVEECEVVNELRHLVCVKLPKIEQYILFHVLDQLVVVPNFCEPLLQLLAVAVAVHDEVQLDVVVSVAETETADGEI